MNYYTPIFLLIKLMTDSATSWWWILPFVAIDAALGFYRTARWAMDRQIQKLKGE